MVETSQEKFLFHSVTVEGERTAVLQNVGGIEPSSTASHPERPESSETAVWEPQITHIAELLYTEDVGRSSFPNSKLCNQRGVTSQNTRIPAVVFIHTWQPETRR